MTSEPHTIAKEIKYRERIIIGLLSPSSKEILSVQLPTAWILLRNSYKNGGAKYKKNPLYPQRLDPFYSETNNPPFSKGKGGGFYRFGEKDHNFDKVS